MYNQKVCKKGISFFVFMRYNFMDMIKKIKLKTIEDLEEFLKNFFKNKDVKIFLFGSRARGESSRFSDIDI